MKNNLRGAAGGSLTTPRPREKCGRLGEKLFLFLVFIPLAILWAAPMALGEGAPQTAVPQETEAVTGPVDYDRAVRLALRRSPFFLKSSLEVEIKHLDETDSKFDMVPKVTFRTQYYVNRPDDSANRPYTLSFVSSGYNPLESYITLQAKKLFTQIAVLAHMQVVSEGIQKLGRMFLEMETLIAAAARQQNFVDLARQNLDYFQNREKIGSGTSLEVKVAAQELNAAKAEQERIAASRKRLHERIKAVIGMKPEQTLELDCKDARRQVMGGFDPASASLEEAKRRSHMLKIAELKKELQQYNITMAKAKLLPTVFFGATTPDPLSTTRSRDLFFSLGLEVPVWDGFKRVRNISRQKTVLRQYEVESDEQSLDLTDKWSDAQENLRLADVNRKTAQAQEELARLKERQGDIRYQSGGELSVLLEGRKILMEAQKAASLNNLNYDLAVLGLRHLSGDLSASYVDEQSWQLQQ
ncbi:MAG: TolC family protein [Deltaproteobacteria bacterium]|nr:MAG: TolC family protein [Deltaproteobacteria bacterium]